MYDFSYSLILTVHLAKVSDSAILPIHITIILCNTASVLLREVVKSENSAFKSCNRRAKGTYPIFVYSRLLEGKSDKS